MEYTLDSSSLININWSAKGTERIVQNVWNLLNTWRYEVAYSRVMGLDPSFLDKPFNVAAAEYSAQVYNLINLYEPRAIVKDIKLVSLDNEGNMQFKVVIEV